MQSLTFQISGIAALLTLLNQLWGYAPLERSLVITIAAGTVVYSVLLVGQAVVRHVLAAAAESEEEPTDEAPPAESSPSTPSVS